VTYVSECNHVTHRDQRPVFVDHLSLGYRGAVGVKNPEERRDLRSRFDLAPQEDVAITDMSPTRLTVNNWSVCQHARRRYLEIS
jgi:hypothetical protein